ncbi:DHH family phosphoesterase [Thermococcus sp. M39]|uniref:DHH family phosphoesterase n=1 Tax=unclassified Thermococcus TaxID=2627626 RepID=UPI001439EAA8|nr:MULTISPECIES: DHH family phosphoesterase [unclassified Thermococcus]NJE08909.1 DHH family phosphoesterase [Thermococcus sp. M39]NJE12817.1 DHH family phosphoesterase [Thermococcus sp. LS2]
MLIIHHWDTDGITSAALVAKALSLEEFENLTLPIGEFRFDERIRNAIEKADKIYVLDLNLPSEVEGISKETIFIDHHIQPRIQNPKVKQINPALNGEYVPSASFVVSQYFGIWNEWTALGALGDIGKKALEIPKVRELLTINTEEALRLVQLIDSNYVVMDREGVEKAVKVLLTHNLRELLEYEPWVKKAEAIEKTINDAIGSLELRDGFAFITFESPFNVISKVARKAVWELGYKGAVVVNRDFHGKAQIYFRISPELADKVDMGKIISLLKEKGFNAGGKREVLGCICEKSKADEVLEIINAHLR